MKKAEEYALHANDMLTHRPICISCTHFLGWVESIPSDEAHEVRKVVEAENSTAKLTFPTFAGDCPDCGGLLPNPNAGEKRLRRRRRSDAP